MKFIQKILTIFGWHLHWNQNIYICCPFLTSALTLALSQPLQSSHQMPSSTTNDAYIRSPNINEHKWHKTVKRTFINKLILEMSLSSCIQKCCMTLSTIWMHSILRKSKLNNGLMPNSSSFYVFVQQATYTQQIKS